MTVERLLAPIHGQIVFYTAYSWPLVQVYDASGNKVDADINVYGTQVTITFAEEYATYHMYRVIASS